MNQRYGAWLFGLLLSATSFSVCATGLTGTGTAPSLSRLHAKHASLACSDCHGDKPTSAATRAAQANDKACQNCHDKSKASAPALSKTPAKHPRFNQDNDCKSCHKLPKTCAPI